MFHNSNRKTVTNGPVVEAGGIPAMARKNGKDRIYTRAQGKGGVLRYYADLRDLGGGQVALKAPGSGLENNLLPSELEKISNDTKSSPESPWPGMTSEGLPKRSATVKIRGGLVVPACKKAVPSESTGNGDESKIITEISSGMTLTLPLEDSLAKLGDVSSSIGQGQK